MIEVISPGDRRASFWDVRFSRTIETSGWVVPTWTNDDEFNEL